MANGLAFRLMGRDGDVDDVVQESFLRALRNLASLKDPQAFASWLCSIVVSVASKTLRRRKLLRRLGLYHDAAPIEPDSLVDATAPPDVAAELRRIYGVIEQLPEEVRIPLVLRKVEGLTIEEISSVVGCSVATVKRRIASGEEALDRRLGTRGARDER